MGRYEYMSPAYRAKMENKLNDLVKMRSVIGIEWFPNKKDIDQLDDDIQRLHDELDCDEYYRNQAEDERTF